jgi:actin-like ATPase involved in cell morphogenesis
MSEKKQIRKIGVDVGTGNIVCAETGEISKNVEFSRVKDAFFKIDPSNFIAGGTGDFGEQMLNKSGALYVKVDGVIHVLGDDAFKFANLFHKECLRPMSKGVLNPNEPVSSLMVKELIKGVAGTAENEDDVLYFCVPANPIDADFNNTFHSKTLQAIFKELGYKNINVMTEGLAVVYSDLESEGFTGIGMSFGAGMVNVAYSFLGVPIFTFSISRGGDWIDENAATATNETKAAIQAVKEQGIDLNNPKNHNENAICIYYEALLEYLVDQFNEMYKNTDKKDLPNITEPISVVVAGGTSLAEGFVDKLNEVIENKNFPVPIKEVKKSSNQLFSVSRGLFNAASVSS